MAGTIPLFLAEDEENSSMARQRVFRDRTDPLDCYDDLELVQRLTSLDLQFPELLG